VSAHSYPVTCLKRAHVIGGICGQQSVQKNVGTHGPRLRVGSGKADDEAHIGVNTEQNAAYVGVATVGRSPILTKFL
jgi:hypothetical protein